MTEPKKYALIEESLLKKLRAQQKPDGTLQPQPQPIEFTKLTSSSSNLYDIVDVLPKRFRNKGKILAHYLENQITLNPQERVVYPEGQVGSHFIDLARYFISSPALKINRPPDASKFCKILKNAGVPNSALGRNLTESKNVQHSKTKWIF